MDFQKDLAKSLGVDKLSDMGASPTGSSQQVGNNMQVEEAWAIKSAEHADVYFNLISSVDTELLQLTPHDDKIYAMFRDQFPHLPVHCLSEKSLKSDHAKSVWRPFCEHFKQLVDDYSFGSLLRLDASQSYTEHNTILVPHIQFLAIEIARNREGVNRCVRSRQQQQQHQQQSPPT